MYADFFDAAPESPGTSVDPKPLAIEVSSTIRREQFSLRFPEGTPAVSFGQQGQFVPIRGDLTAVETIDSAGERISSIYLRLMASPGGGTQYWGRWHDATAAAEDYQEHSWFDQTNLDGDELYSLPREILDSILRLVEGRSEAPAQVQAMPGVSAAPRNSLLIPKLDLDGRIFRHVTIVPGQKGTEHENGFLLFAEGNRSLGKLLWRAPLGLGDEYLSASNAANHAITDALLELNLIEDAYFLHRGHMIVKAKGALKEITGEGFPEDEIDLWDE